MVMIHALMTMQKLSTTEQMFRRPSMSAMVTESRTGASASNEVSLSLLLSDGFHII